MKPGQYLFLWKEDNPKHQWVIKLKKVHTEQYSTGETEITIKYKEILGTDSDGKRETGEPGNVSALILEGKLMPYTAKEDATKDYPEDKPDADFYWLYKPVSKKWVSAWML